MNDILGNFTSFLKPNHHIPVIQTGGTTLLYNNMSSFKNPVSLPKKVAGGGSRSSGGNKIFLELSEKWSLVLPGWKMILIFFYFIYFILLHFRGWISRVYPTVVSHFTRGIPNLTRMGWDSRGN